MRINALARTGLVAACLAVAAATMTPAQTTPPQPQPVMVVNQTRFVPVARETLIPAGQSQRFEVRADGYSRVNLLLAGTTTPGATGGLRIATQYGLPFVPGGLSRGVVTPNGEIRARVPEPVAGPAMAIIVTNDLSADATITLSAYLTN